MWICCDAVCGEGVQEGKITLAPLSAGFVTSPHYPQAKWALLVLIRGWVGGFVYILGTYGSLQQTLLWSWEFLPLLPQPPQVFSISGLRLYFPALEPWVAQCFIPQLFLPFYLHSSVGLPALPGTALPQVLSTQLPVSAPLTSLDECVFFNSLVVELPYSPIFWQLWLFFVFKLLLSFFWLCKKAQCVYLHLHLGRKSKT